MRIALAGPLRVPALAPWLDLGAEDAPLPAGLGHTPVTLLARTLLRRGHHVTVASFDLAVTAETVLTGPRLRICLQPFRAGNRGRDAYRVERRLLEATLRREAPDLVHAHWSYEYALAAQASGLPTLVTVHDWAPSILRWMPDAYRAVRLGMFVRALAAADHMTTVSPHMAARLRRWRRRVVPVVPNGLEDTAFDDRTRTLNATTPLLVSISDGFVPWKNTARLLEAHQLIRAVVPGARLVLVGAGHGPDQDAQRWAAARGLTAGVEFRGEVAYGEVTALLARADLLVHPSLEESFGLVALEAMAQSLPVVAGARSGAVPWVVGPGGVLTDVTSAPAIATAVTELLADPRRWSTLSHAAHARAWSTFRIDGVLDAYLTIYERVAQPSRASTARERST